LPLSAGHNRQANFMENIHTFLQLLFFSVIALFPVVNPIGTAFIISPYFSGLSNREKKAAVKKITRGRQEDHALCLLYLRDHPVRRTLDTGDIRIINTHYPAGGRHHDL